MGPDRIRRLVTFNSLLEQTTATIESAVNAYRPRSRIKGVFYGVDTFLRPCHASSRIDDALGASEPAISDNLPEHPSANWRRLNGGA